MRAGKTNKLDDLSVTLTSSVDNLAGFPKENVLDEETLKLWKVENGTVILTLEFSSISAEAICVFNTNIEDDIVVKTFNSGATETNSITKNESDLPGLDSINGFFELETTTDIVKIQIIMNGATSSFQTSIGYIWVGDLINFKNLEALAPTDEDTADTIITRANSISAQDKYNFQRFKFTTDKKELFTDVQNNVREIIQNGGYNKKRPFIFEECVYSTPNLVLGIFDSGVFQYDLLDPDNLYAQISKGILEVF